MAAKKRAKKASNKAKKTASKKRKVAKSKAKTRKSGTKKTKPSGSKKRLKIVRKVKAGKKRPQKKKTAKKRRPQAVKINPDIHIIGHKIETRHEKFHKKVKKQYKDPDAVDDLFRKPKKWTVFGWMKRYSPVLITLCIGLLTYIYLVFYMFYPTAIAQGHYIQFLIVILFIFLIAGILIFLGLRSELLFVRILSFIFVFVIFTFLLLFVLVAHALNGLG